MRFLNMRLLVVTLVLVLLALGGVIGWRWYFDQPEQLLASAQRYFDRATEARTKDDSATALQNYQFAEAQLVRALDKNPGNARAWYLRHRVANDMAPLVAKDESPDAPAEKRESLQLKRKSTSYAAQAALDPSFAPAQAVMLDIYLREFSDSNNLADLAQAAEYGERLLKVRDSADFQNFPSREQYLQGAHYALGKAALAYSPAQPNEALAQAAASEAMTRPQPQRWRMVAVEAQARELLKREFLERKTRPGAGRRLGPGEDVVKTFNERAAQWAERARGEMEDRGGKSPLSRLGATDARGLFDTIAVIARGAEGRGQVADSLDLAVEVAEKMTADADVPKHISREAIAGVTRVDEAISKLPAERRPRPEEVEGVRGRLEKLTVDVVGKGATVDPRTFLLQSRKARAAGETARAVELAKKGLDAARVAKYDVSNSADVIDLHLESAWLLLSQRKQQEANEHLDVLRKNQRTSGVASLIQGLAAVLDGRLEEAETNLTAASQRQQLADNLGLQIALAHTYLGLGKYDLALDLLKRLQTRFEKSEKLSPEDQALAAQLLPSKTQIELEMVRCNLALAVKDPKKLEDARKLRAQLADRPEGTNASLLLINYFTNLGVLLRAGGQNQQALEAFKVAAEELNAAEKVSKDNARLVLARANLLLNQPTVSLNEIDRAVVSLMLPPSHVGNHLVENLRLRSALAINVAVAEQLLKAYAFDRKGPGNAPLRDSAGMLAWVDWLRRRGRTDEALAQVAVMEKAEWAKDVAAQLPFLKAGLLLSKGATSEVAKMMEEEFQGKKDLNTEMIQLMLDQLEGKTDEARKRLQASLSRVDTKAQEYFLKAQMARGLSEFRQAIPQYERAMQFAAYKAAAQSGLLQSLLGLAGKESPKEAYDEAVKLKARHPKDPAVLMAVAETARMVDNIEGNSDAMIDSLKALEDQLGKRNPVLGPYFLARAWNAVGRPDLARKEAERALAAGPEHQPSLLLAGQLAVAAEDWDNAVTYADRLQKLQPNLIDPRLWRAAALEGQGKADDALKLWNEMKSSYANVSAGYMGRASVLERVKKDLNGALAQVREWRKLAPADLTALRAEVRLLTKLNKADDAHKLGEQYLADQSKQLKELIAEAARKQPPKESDKEARAKQEEAALAAQELAIRTAVASGYHDARVWDKAEEWYKSSQPAAEKTAENVRKANAQAVKMQLADVYLQRGQAEKSKQYTDQAIAIYRVIYEETPSNVIAANNLAWLLNDSKPGDKSALAIINQMRKPRYGEKPVTGDRMPVELLDTIGVVYRATEEFKEYRTVFEDALKRYANEPRVHYHLGLALAAERSTRADAFQRLSEAAKLAREKAQRTLDPDRKAKLEKLALDAEKERQSLQR